ncbi:CDGSH iron-sulfur domain-containing protein [Streptomyces sp. NPDC048258]|uniref:CDGSH iron-sulfur domain-containing protein n=1 Tax=Streptomyces sp. NPDC048258 TaxID=3365527 RepID=UPI00370FEEFD
MPSASDGTAGGTPGRARRVAVDPQGPVLVEGPVEIVLDDGTVARSDRFVVALCTCRRSRTYPWCDTSHRPRRRAVARPQEGVPDAPGRPEQQQPGQDRPERHRPVPPPGTG